jgi:hypothetical protein
MLLAGKRNQSADAASLTCFSGKGGRPQILTHTVADPTLRKKREGPRISYCAAPAMGTCAAFY